MTGENLIVPSLNLAWFKGPTLLSALDSLPLPKEHPHPERDPLRLAIKSVFETRNRVKVYTGKIVSGIL